MKRINIENELIIEELKFADSFISRFKGLMLQKGIADNSGLMLIPCNGVHTFFMRFNIDVCYVDRNNKIIDVFYNVPPWRMLPIKKKCHYVLEFKAGTLNEKHSLIGKECSITN